MDKVTRTARRILEKNDIKISGEGYSIRWLLTEGAKSEDIDRLRDEVSKDWRDVEARRSALYQQILRQAPAIADYEKLRDELCYVEEDANFALGFAAAVRFFGH